MRILLAPFPERGHYTPFIAVARRLAEAGHLLACHCTRDLSPVFDRAGLSAELSHEGGMGQRQLPGSQVTNARRMELWYASAALNGFSTASIDAAAQAIGRFRPDVIVVDPTFYAAVIAAHRSGAPWASVSTNLTFVAPVDLKSTMIRAMASVRGELLKRFEAAGAPIDLVHQEVVSPWLNTVFTVPAFAPRHLSGQRSAWYVGPVAWESPRGDEPAIPPEVQQKDGPFIYASVGGGESLMYPPDVVLRIANGIPRRAAAVFALQALADDPVAATLPPHVIGVRQAPQVALLGRAAAAVSHGGAGTTAECLRSGVPQLVIPIGHDQPVQAELVRRSGIGLTLGLDATAEQIEGALEQLLRDEAFRGCAQRLAELCRGVDGAARVAELVVALATTRKPMPPPDTDA